MTGMLVDGVLLQGGALLNNSDWVIFPGPNPAADPMEIRFSPGLLEQNDVIQVYAAFK